MDTPIEEFFEQIRQGMNLMREACGHIPWEQCLKCPFYLDCDKSDRAPYYWEEN